MKKPASLLDHVCSLTLFQCARLGMLLLMMMMMIRLVMSFISFLLF